MEWKVGDKALCVSKIPQKELDVKYPQVGEVYTVRDICFYGEIGLLFIEIVNPCKYYREAYGEGVFLPKHFVKLNDNELEDQLQQENKDIVTV